MRSCTFARSPLERFWWCDTWLRIGPCGDLRAAGVAFFWVDLRAAGVAFFWVGLRAAGPAFFWVCPTPRMGSVPSGPFFFSFFGSGLFGSVPPLGQQGWLFFGLTFGRQVRLFLGLSRPSYRVRPFSCIAPRENPVAKAYGRPENSEGRSVIGGATGRAGM